MVPDLGSVTRNGIFGAATRLLIYQISVNVIAVTRIALQNRSLGCGECDMERVMVRSKFQVFLVRISVRSELP